MFCGFDDSLQRRIDSLQVHEKTWRISDVTFFRSRSHQFVCRDLVRMPVLTQRPYSGGPRGVEVSSHAQVALMQHKCVSCDIFTANA